MHRAHKTIDTVCIFTLEFSTNNQFFSLSPFVSSSPSFLIFWPSFLSVRELEDKSEQLLRVKKEKTAVLSDLEAKLAAREREVRNETRKLEYLLIV